MKSPVKCAVLTLPFALSSCGALREGPQPLPHTVRTNDASRVAYVSVATTNVIKWDDVAEDLNKPQFTPTATDLLNDAVQVTSSVNAQTMDALSASVAATLAGTSIDRTNTTATDATGTAITTGNDVHSRQSPSAPSDVTFNIQPPSFPTSNAATGTGTEAQLKYDVAKALAEEVAIKNREVTSIAQRTKYRPYFVNMKVAVEPYQRGYPYDILLDLQLSTTSGSPIVLPLLVTDAMETTSESQTAQIVRELGGELKATAGFVGASASLQKTLSRLDQTLAARANSLLTVAQYGENGVRVRLGANAYGETYEMIPRTHSISLIVLVPYDVAKSATADDRLVTVTGKMHYYDAGGEREVADPGPFTSDPVVQVTNFQIPKQDTTECPQPQDAVLDIVSIAASGSTPAAKYDSVVLAQGVGLQGRTIMGQLDAPAPGKGKSLRIFATSAVPSAAGTLQFTFPEHTSFVGGERGALRTGVLSFKIQPDDAQGELSCPTSVPGGKEVAYRVIYPTLAAANPKPAEKPAVKKAADGKKAAGPKKAAPKPAAAAATPTLVAPTASEQSAQSPSNAAPPTPAYTTPK